LHQEHRTNEPLARRYFHCHPKGTGVICKAKEGLAADKFVSEYLGDLYPAWRWNEKLDAIEEAKLKHGLKPDLPDFYNMIMERPRGDARGYGLLYVDAGNHVGNFSSSLSHSCNPNCATATAIRNGKICVSLTTTRAIAYGEELTMDYSALTSCETEFHKAVCLCGSQHCRQSFMTFTGQESLHEVLRGFGPLMVFRGLIQSAADTPMTPEEEDVLQNHGLKSSALGDHCPTWLKKFAAMQVRYAEYERRKLPPALMARKGYNYQVADSESRSVMERRLSNLVEVLSGVYHFLREQKTPPSALPALESGPATPSSSAFRRGGGGDSGQLSELAEKPPLQILGDGEVIEALWSGRQSMMRRLVRKLDAVYCHKLVVETPEERPPVRRVARRPAKVKTSPVNVPAPRSVAPRRKVTHPVILRERILVWDRLKQWCIMNEAPPRDELVGWLARNPNSVVYTGQGDPFNGPGEGGIFADNGEPRSPDDIIYLWDAINRSRLPLSESPTRRNLAAFISVRPHIFLYAGQDVPEHMAWYGAWEARGVADAYAAVVALSGGDEDERIPLWDTVAKKKITGDGE
ncbi:unnamed protein product, partial [Hapterophycus canaliculatus]